MDIEAYRAAWKQAHGYFSMNLVSSRGCPYRCNWCAKPIFGVAIVSDRRSAWRGDGVQLKTRFEPDQIWFADEFSRSRRSGPARFAEAVERHRRRDSVQDAIALRSDDPRHGGGAAAGRLRGSVDGRGIRVAEDPGRHGQRHARRADLRGSRKSAPPRHSRLLFSCSSDIPARRGRTSNKPSAWCATPSRTISAFRFPIRCRARDFIDRVASELGEKENWRDSDDLAMMFHGAYSTEFYRALADALHAEVRGGDPQWERVYALEKASARRMPVWTCC